ncbi:MAG: flippase [Methanomicrobia archaeon]|nr:flippase [Methanomicrobia archaeon]
MLARKSTLIIITQLLNGLLAYVALKFIAVYMEPWEYGVVGFSYGFVALFSIIGQLGFDHAHIKRVSEGKDLGTCVGTFAAIKLSLASLMVCVVIGSVATWKYILGRGFETPVHEIAIYIMLAHFVLHTVTQIFVSTFNARREIAKSQLPNFSFTLARVVATLFVAYYGFGALALVSTYLLGEIFHLLLALVFFRDYPLKKPTWEYFRGYFTFALPMALVSTSYIIMTSVDKVFIQFFWGATQVGEYFAVFNFSRVIILFVSAVGLLLFPTISEYHARNNGKEIEKLVLKSERYLSMIVFPIIIIIIALAEPIIHILISDEYMPALSVLHILPLFVLLESLAYPYVSKLQGMNMPWIVRDRYLIMVICNVFLNLLLIPKEIGGLGAQGAAIATVVAYAVGFIYIRVMAWKNTHILGYSRIILHALAATMMGIILVYINQTIHIQRWYELLIIILCGFAIYLGILLMIREFKREDFDFFVDTLNLKEMIRYIKEDLSKK